MMNLGMTTKNWGAPQDQKLPVDKGSKVAAGQNPFGDKDIGSVLNEIADPNYIEPAKVQRENKSELDKDAFFKLMLTQMKNQDPMNPMQSHEMEAHLAQFTSLEQMFNVNANLEAMRKMQTPLKDYQALSFIGKDVSADSSMVMRYKDDSSHDLRFSILTDAAEAKVAVKNEQGDTVRTLKMSNLKKGSNSIRWDGLNDNGQPQGEGEYRFSVDAVSGAGTKVTVDTNASGRITGVQFTKKGPLLLIENQQVFLSDVKKIMETKEETAKTPEGAKVSPEPILPSQLPNGIANGLPNGLGLAAPTPASKPQQVTKTIPEQKEKSEPKGASMKPPQNVKRGAT